MPAEDDHILTRPRIGAAVGDFGPLGIGIALMAIAMPHMNLVFFLGFGICLLTTVGACALGYSEIKKWTTIGRIIAGMIAIDLVVPFALLLYAFSDAGWDMGQIMTDARANITPIATMMAGVIVVGLGFSRWRELIPSVSRSSTLQEVDPFGTPPLVQSAQQVEATTAHETVAALQSQLKAAQDQIKSQQLMGAEFQTKLTSRITELERVRQNSISARCVSTILGFIESRKSTLDGRKTIIVTSSASENRGLGASLVYILQYALQQPPGQPEAFRFVVPPDAAHFPDAPALEGGSQAGVTVHRDSPAARVIGDAFARHLNVRQTKTFFVNEANPEDVRVSLLDYYRTRAIGPMGPLVGFEDIIWLQIGPHSPWGQDSCD